MGKERKEPKGSVKGCGVESGGGDLTHLFLSLETCRAFNARGAAGRYGIDSASESLEHSAMRRREGGSKPLEG
ncbi:hypothetical protein TNIN_153581 [Trichonephila inaurata madagascariensis]|uniref:Uncharacterized protein n=1 Tax=Trichonephila inaurata madagascariensis TaxID=2747483 RepID=A0A8X6Y1H2_9ARAC|nr:hypothetical protein TNIN_153581 [Trichonephila inaurata madagascariensis]